MNVKVIIANNNDILYSNLSNLMLQNEPKIEVIKIAPDKLQNLICLNKLKNNLIILDGNTSVSFCSNIIRNATNIDKGNIIILVIDSNNLVENIKHKQENNLFSWQRNTIIPLLEVVNVVSNSLKESLKIEKRVDDILWKMGFVSYYKGTIYLKEAILMAYDNKNLLYDINILIKKVSQKYNVINEKVVRSAMDKALNNILDYVDTKIIYNIFGDNYDGRKISLKYFIDLCVHDLEQKRNCCLEI